MAGGIAHKRYDVKAIVVVLRERAQIYVGGTAYALLLAGIHGFGRRYGIGVFFGRGSASFHFHKYHEPRQLGYYVDFIVTGAGPPSGLAYYVSLAQQMLPGKSLGLHTPVVGFATCAHRRPPFLSMASANSAAFRGRIYQVSSILQR